MSAKILITGRLRRVSRCYVDADGHYVFVTVVDDGDWWLATATSEAVITQIERLPMGEPLSIAGELKVEASPNPHGGPPLISFDVRIDAVLNACDPRAAQ